VLAVAVALGPAPAAAQDTFTGKAVTIYVGFGPGGGYDLYARVLARHLGRHLPGRPTVVVANMPGAASIRAANYIANVAPKDGTALGMVAQSIAEEQLLASPALATTSRGLPSSDASRPTSRSPMCGTRQRRGHSTTCAARRRLWPAPAPPRRSIHA
jgi:hypothetical protein